MDDFIKCFACGSNALNIDGETHAYMLSSPGCWIMFGEVLEREYSDFTYAKAHHYSVDAYATQHIGNQNDVRAVNSVNIHLASLYMMFEKNLDIKDAADFKMNYSQFYKGSGDFIWLEPPISFGDLTIYELWDNNNPDIHFSLAEKWAKSVWNSWEKHHQTISKLVNNFLNA